MSSININDVSQLMEITGLDKSTAEDVLQINNYDLEQAINYHYTHLENSCSTTVSSGTATTIKSNGTDYNSSGMTKDDCNRKIKSNKQISHSSKHEYSNSNNKNSNSAYSSSSTSSLALPSSSTSLSERSEIGTASVSDTYEEVIRAPIPSRREQLLQPEDDNFRFRKRRAPAFTVCPLRNFAREAELQEQQLAATGAVDDYSSLSAAAIAAAAASSSALSSASSSRYYYNEFSSPSSSSSITGLTSIASDSALFSKKSRLEDLFRPPTDLLFWGTFQSARDYATSRNRWLIVNLQDNSEFKSQILNRDIWPDPELKELILKYFIFWQVSVDNPEGLRFKIFYHVEQMPYVCVIDPRTGENRFSRDVVTPQTFCSDLHEFLTQNSYVLDPRKSDSLSGASSSSSPSSLLFNNIKSDTIIRRRPLKTSELSEEDQLELAIRNSLKETQTSTIATSTNNDDDNSLDGGDTTAGYEDSTTQSEQDLNDTNTTGSGRIGDTTTNCSDDDEADIDNDDNAIDNDNDTDDNENAINNKKIQNKKCSSLTFQNYDKEALSVQENNSYEQYMGDKSDPVTKIQLRLPNGERVQLEWPSSTKLRAIKLYVESKYPDIAKDPYKIILSFPRQNILELDDELTLKAANLHPNVILHLHPDD